MELQYEKALKQYKLNIADLPHDAKVGIKSVQELQRAIAMKEKQGKKVRQDVMDRFKALDKWAYYEILDHVNDTDENEDFDDDAAKKAIKDAKIETPPAPAPVKKTPNQASGDEAKAQIVNDELKALFESGKMDYSIAELKSVAPTTYDVIFDGYDEEEENGVTTHEYSLMETEKEMFKLAKK